jgi:Fe-S-cluster containining protein
MQKFYQIEKRDKLSRDFIHEFFAYLQKKNWADLHEEQVPFNKMSGLLEKSVIRDSSEEIPDCQSCGICCFLFVSVQLTSNDKLLPLNYWEITINSDDNKEIVVDKLLRRNGETGTCIHLSGELGKNVSCEIYDERPSICRKFDAGSDRCHALRRFFGYDKPLTQFEEMNATMKLFLQDDEEKIFHSEINAIPNSNLLEIKVFFEDESFEIIGNIDSEKQTLIEGDFVGLILAEAKELLTKNNLL